MKESKKKEGAAGSGVSRDIAELRREIGALKKGLEQVKSEVTAAKDAIIKQLKSELERERKIREKLARRYQL